MSVFNFSFLFLFSEYMVDFIFGECRLEEYLEKYPPSEKNINKAISELSEAEALLTRVANGESRVRYYKSRNGIISGEEKKENFASKIKWTCLLQTSKSFYW